MKTNKNDKGILTYNEYKEQYLKTEKIHLLIHINNISIISFFLFASLSIISIILLNLTMFIVCTSITIGIYFFKRRYLNIKLLKLFIERFDAKIGLALHERNLINENENDDDNENLNDVRKEIVYDMIENPNFYKENRIEEKIKENSLKNAGLNFILKIEKLYEKMSLYFLHNTIFPS